MMNYFIAGYDGGEYSANYADYWSAPDNLKMNGDLIKYQHVYKTVTGKRVIASRLIKSNVTVGDLRRLQRWGKVYL